MSKSEYCRSNGITENTFDYWRSKLKKSEEARFVKVGVELKYELKLSTGAVLSFPINTGMEQLKSIIAAVASA